MEYLLYNNYKINVIRKFRQKTIRLLFRKHGIFVTCCNSIRKKDIILFLDRYKDKIENYFSTLKNIKLGLHYLGKFYPLEFIKGKKEFKLLDDKIVISSSYVSSSSLKRFIKECYIQEFKSLFYQKLLPYVLDRLNSFPFINTSGLEYEFFYKDKVLGQCTKQRVIRFSGRLLKYDLETIFSVIFHEFSHLVYFNHSPDFKKLLCSIYPKATTLNACLKEDRYMFDYV